MAGRIGIGTLRLGAACLLAAGIGLPFGAACAATETPAGADHRVTLTVPPGLEQPPFDVPRSLRVPPGFSIRVFARVPDARFMALAPNGDLLVTSPATGSVTLLRPAGGAAPASLPFATGLRMPHGIAFHVIGDTTYLYLAESHRIIRAAWHSGDIRLGAIEVVVDHLPDGSTPGLHGRYNHPLKNFTLHRGKLYVSIGSSCNACAADTAADPVRGSIYVTDENGANPRLYARGVRNAEGLAFRPGSDALWAVVNNRDNIAYPLHRRFDGPGGGHGDDFGRVMQGYVDGHPPDLLTQVKDGGQYGWPFCNADPDAGLTRMPYQRDAELNADGARLDCGAIDRATQGLPPHSAPLGLRFLQDSGLPPAYRNALATALHGCWNCSALNGHQIMLYPFRPDGSLGGAVELVGGWIVDTAARQRWGRPVDLIADGKGGLYLSDDYSGTIYLLRAAGE